MSPSAVPPAARQEKQSVMEAAVATGGPRAVCSPQNAPRAAKTPKFPLNPAVINRFTVAIATVKPGRVGNSDNPEASLRPVANSQRQLGLAIDIEKTGDQVVEHDGSKVLLVENELAITLRV